MKPKILATGWVHTSLPYDFKKRGWSEIAMAKQFDGDVKVHIIEANRETPKT